MCQASSDPDDEMFFHNMNRDAPHRGTLISHRYYMECCARERAEPSAIFEVPGVTLDMLVVDAMHAADLGVFQECIRAAMQTSSHDVPCRDQAIPATADASNEHSIGKPPALEPDSLPDQPWTAWPAILLSSKHIACAKIST
jgi:hypothetical protein